MAINTRALRSVQPSHGQAATREPRTPGAVGLVSNLGGGQRRRSRIGRKERKFFLEQLALLIETGTPLVPAVDMIAEQAADAPLAPVLEAIADQMRDGSSFAAALRNNPESFPGSYATLVEAAEQGGYLDRVLNHLLDVEQRREELEATMVAAFTYPAFLVLFSVGVVVFILGVVFPKFADLFASIADQLPSTTRFLMWASDLLTAHPLVSAGVVTALAAAAAWWCMRPGAGAILCDVCERIPGLRQILLEFYLIQSMRILNLSLNNGVTLVDALKACKGVVPSPRFNRFLGTLADSVVEGRGFAHGFEGTTLVPSLACQMLATGEESGRLNLVTGRIADYYQTLLKRRLNALAKLVEPLMLLVMGVAVGILVSSLILPIFKLSRAVH